MIKVRIKKNDKVIFESNSYKSYDNTDFLEFDFYDLSNANLSYADLSYADLSYVDLKYADLSNTSLDNACLYNANLDEQERIRQGIVLDESMIGYKKAIIDNKIVIVTLKIPKNAIVFSINNKKCRTNICKVIDIEGNFNKAYSFHDNKFVYKKGKTIRIKNFNLQYNVECATGIHFFKTKQEALDYNY